MTTKNLTPLNLSILGSKDLDFLSSFNTQEGMSGFTQTQYIYKYHYRPQLPIEPKFLQKSNFPQGLLNKKSEIQ